MWCCENILRKDIISKKHKSANQTVNSYYTDEMKCSVFKYTLSSDDKNVIATANKTRTYHIQITFTEHTNGRNFSGTKMKIIHSIRQHYFY